MEIDLAGGRRLLGLVFALLVACSSPSQDGSEPARTLAGATTRFVVVGDYGTADAVEQDVASEVKEWTSENDADALVTTGDNAYPYATPDTLEAAWAPYGWVNDELAVIASLGNHDVENDGGTSTIEFFGLPGAWYEMTSGIVDFIVLDANRPEDAGQQAWLRQALARSGADWKVIVFHQPAFSCSNHGGDSRIVENWVPLFEEFGVNLVLSGHDHNYQRFLEDGITYVVTGGGGSDLYGIVDCPEGTPARIAADDQHHHFLGIEVSNKEMLVQAIEPGGQVLDGFSIQPGVGRS